MDMTTHPAIAATSNAADNLDPADFTVVQSTLHQLQQEIADESARSDVECIAQAVPSYHNLMPVYRLDEISSNLPSDDDMREDYAAAPAKAVRYLDLRQLLVRPVKGEAQFVCFARAS